MPESSIVDVAVVQQPSVFFDLEGSDAVAAEHVRDAAARGASLVVFPEVWFGGYPAWVFGRAGWQDPVAKRWYARLLETSPVLGPPDDLDDDLREVRRAAADHGVTVVVGVNERNARHGGTLYNSLVTIDERGHLANVHRKLTPTHAEKLVWAPGDGAGLRAVDTRAGRVGGLVCWEHWNPLARQALHAEHEQVHVAAFPDAPPSHQLAARSYAFEGRCHVVLAAAYVSVQDLPDELVDDFRRGADPAQAEGDVLFDGGSAVAGPTGEWLVPPVVGEPGLVHARLDLGSAAGEKLDMDLAGHYQRPDVFRLDVDRSRRGGGVRG